MAQAAGGGGQGILSFHEESCGCPRCSFSVIGTPDAIYHVVANLGRRFFMGISAANRLFAPQPR